MKTIYLFDPVSRVFAGESEHPLDPVESERAAEPVYALINRAMATEERPPNIPSGQQAVREGNAWVLREVPEHTAAAPTAAPRSQVTMRQARLALLASGHLSQVDALIQALPEAERAAVRIEWEYAATVERDSPLVALLSQALLLDADALDALFIDAAAR
jgi:hypothetical protein